MYLKNNPTVTDKEEIIVEILVDEGVSPHPYALRTGFCVLFDFKPILFQEKQFV